MRKSCLLFILINLAAPLAGAQPGRFDTMTMAEKVSAGRSFHTTMAQPEAPFRILGNVYYVGASNIASYLITTPDGHFLLDTGVSEMGPLIRANVEALGFRLSDIRILLSSHAHFDHVQGHAVMQRLTGAQVMALDADADALATGMDLSPLGFEGWEPVRVDRRLADGETITLGGISMTPVWSPGHTPGCTNWLTTTRDGDRDYELLFFGCNGPNDGVRLLGNPNFPDLEAQAREGFATLKGLDPDIYLTGHPQAPFADVIDQLRVQVRPHPLLNQVPWSQFINAAEAAFLRRLEEERNGNR
jgi:metallo-beta-lactamase class B